ncbi:MAG: 3-methylcrotonyl-CoA carboxylase [Gammaproteobacteria bacterium]|nr:3-methylcrotonyl-CoA carboxylase [Gammaproteobacteria bacterium]
MAKLLAASCARRNKWGSIALRFILSVDSYLCGDKIIAIAKKTGAEAIHPGYGFLSENAGFAAACEKAKIIFIGPTPAAILAMGSKSQAKEIMTKAKVPCTPGYHGERQDIDFLLQEAKKIGFPVLIKAAMGGGGKGMRRVDEAKHFKEALESAQREALSSFGDKRVLLEKYVLHPRHIEIQVMADNHNNAIYLFERDCSIQRRHQKIIEEAPGLGISNNLRRKMGETAVTAAKTIGYRGAGTIEFLLDSNNQFYFMEMNTRLQVEHPVTEMITGFDLVAWQLRIAYGEPLAYQQKNLKWHGHAIEVRLYAEDTQNDFLPATGTIHYLSSPTINKHIRIDSGIQEKDNINSYYDPMMAKLIVHAETRLDAITELKNALQELHVIGVKNNRAFLQKLIALDDFIDGKINTSFIEEHAIVLKAVMNTDRDPILCAAALYLILDSSQNTAGSEDVFSPWTEPDGFRLQLPYQRCLHFKYGDENYAVTVMYRGYSGGSRTAPTAYTLQIKDKAYSINIHEKTGPSLRFAMNDSIQTMQIIQYYQQLWIICDGIEYALQSIESLHTDYVEHEQRGHLTAPMPGAIVAVHVKAGDTVQKDDCLVVMEAMKMEHSIYAPQAGIVREVFYTAGDRVDEGAELLAFD